MGQLCCIFIWRNLTHTSNEKTTFKTALPQRKGKYESRTPPSPPQIQKQHDISQTNKNLTQSVEKTQEHYATEIPKEQWNRSMCDTELFQIYESPSVPSKSIKRRVVASEKSGRLISGCDSWTPPISTRHFKSVNLPFRKTPRQQQHCENGPSKPPRQLVFSSEEALRQQICDVSLACPIPESRNNRSSMELQQPPKQNTVYAKGPRKPPRLFTYDAETQPIQQICDTPLKPPIPSRQHNVSVPTTQFVYVPSVTSRDSVRSDVTQQITTRYQPQAISTLLLYRPKGELVPIDEDRELDIQSSLAS